MAEHSELEGQLLRENEELRAAVEALEEQVEQRDLLADQDVRQLFAKYIWQSELKRRSDPETSREDFKDWEEALLERSRKREGAYRSLAFCMVMDMVLRINSDFRRIPFFYYDFRNQEAIPTPATLELFNISDFGDEKLSLHRLMKEYVDRDYRRRLFTALEKGEALESYYFESSGRGIYLNAYPLAFEEGKYREVVGYGVFLRAQDDERYDMGTAMRFAVHVRKVVRKLGDEFRVIRLGVKKVF